MKNLLSIRVHRTARLLMAATALIWALAACHCLAGDVNNPGPIKVEIRKENGQFRLYRGGQPYYIKGAVYGGANGKFPLADLASRGANSIRTGTDRRTLDAAQKLGLTALVNLPMKMEFAHKFDYSNEPAVREQFEDVKRRVLELKDHSAVLMWAIGNELSVFYTNRRVWNAVNDIARMIHEVDPNHPALTVIGDSFVNDNNGDFQEIIAHCPQLDLIGINFYKGLEAVPARVRAEGWNKPYVITEWGPSGDWQVPRTAWNASIEETSTEKAERYLARYQNTMLKDLERCLGSYVFVWTWRHERTQTWYGMFLESGERTDAVNVMQFLWSGRWPPNRAPRIAQLAIDGHAALDNIYLKPASEHTARVDVSDPDGDPISLRWEVLAEVARAGYAGMGEKRSKPMPEQIRQAAGRQLTFAAPAQEGAYRVFVFATDGQGNGATANIPFFVKP
ncbi:MAG: glycoside hydrolase family 2 TIM barrel-domain containing protein [Bryobacteraceae bacterium]